MSVKNILVFGYGAHGRHIAKGLLDDGYLLKIVEEKKEHYKRAIEDGLTESVLIDMSRDESLLELDPQSYDQVVCIMDDEHYNVFITLSLSSLFPELSIVAISDSIHTSSKLKLAGASKVIDLYEVSANRIHNILNRPVATQLLKDFVMSKTGISFMEMEVPKGSFLHGKEIDDVDFSCYDVLLVGLVDKSVNVHSFEFVTAGHEHTLESGDIIVCMGEVEKLRNFKKLLHKKVDLCQEAKA